jgi:hypothetical protein
MALGMALFALLGSGCFRSKMLTPRKVACAPGDSRCSNPTPGDRDGSIASDGRDGDGRRDGIGGDGNPTDGKTDARNDAAADGFRDGARDGTTGDGRADDGRRDGVLDGARDGRTDGRSDAVVCGFVEICGNDVDDDCNGLADCFDKACQADPSCINRKKELCDNRIDDDDNGLVDCEDPACFGDKACATPGAEVCNNNLDDDDDGLVDCKDSDCSKDPSCQSTPGDEICDNGKDDNGDGLVDCTDPKCTSFPACLQSACAPDADFGTLAASGASVSKTLSTVGASASFATCAPPGGVARVAGFALTSPADVRLDFSQPKGAAHVVALFRAGVGQSCDQNPTGECLRVGDKASATQTFTALQAGSYWLVVQSFAGTEGSTTVTLSTGTAGVSEICDNGKDDDGDGAIDCADLGCASAANCTLCAADVNLGTIVLGAAAKTATLDTTKTSNRYHPACAGTSTGNDAVVRFSVKEAVGVSIRVQQTGDHVYEVVDVPATGAACDSLADGQNCGNLAGRPSVRYTWTGFAPGGEYLIIFKAIAPGQEGTLSVSLSAFATGGIELCTNEVDDDSDGLIDCDDPDCYGVSPCTAPMCIPDGDLGDFDIGTRTSFQIDLTTATQVYQTGCNKGNGHGRAYRINLVSPMMLGVSCSQTGDQVLALSKQLTPLDLCDANTEGSCGDTGVIGCNFAFPSLQPGPYFLLVQAQASGTEGVMNLTLTGEQERTLEICNNAIDDDGDGATDCNDRKCATDPSCRSQRCQVEEDLGLLATDGTLYATALQTSNAGDDQQKTTCVSGAGGADVVVGFTLPGTTDLAIEWAQVGNHALMLYKADVAPLPCEANQAVDCKATAGTGLGTWNLTGLAAGKYYLVVDADKAGSEGGLVLQMTGLPSK